MSREGIVHSPNKHLPPVIKHLKHGCLHIQRDAEGNACRWKLLNLAFKGEADTTHGVPAPGRSASRSRGRWRCSSG